MKPRNQNIDFAMLWVKVGIILLTAIVLTFALSGCRSTKTSSTTTQSSTSVDTHYRDSIRTIDSIAITKRLEEKYKELMTDVTFYQSNEEILVQSMNELQDSLNARGFLSDSLKSRIKRVIDSIRVNPCKNEVTINKDGSVKFTGEIKSLKLKLSEMQRIMDSAAVAERETTEISESDTVIKTDEKTEVTKTVKKGWPFWVWLLIGYSLGVITMLLYKRK